jgi:hypothetical protein
MIPTPQFTAELTFHFREHGPDRRRWFIFDEGLHRRIPMQMDGVEGLNTVGLWSTVPAKFDEGDSITVRCMVIAPEIFSPIVRPGVTFELWDSGFFASGKVLERIEAGWPLPVADKPSDAVGAALPTLNESGTGVAGATQHAGQTAAILGCVGVLVTILYYAYTYPYPSGEPPSFWSFVGLWLREILILAFVFIGILMIIAGWMVRLMLRLRSRAPGSRS